MPDTYEKDKRGRIPRLVLKENAARGWVLHDQWCGIYYEFQTHRKPNRAALRAAASQLLKENKNAKHP